MREFDEQSARDALAAGYPPRDSPLRAIADETALIEPGSDEPTLQ